MAAIRLVNTGIMKAAQCSPKKRLLIIGAGGFGREVYALATELAQTADWRIGGFLDANPDALQQYAYPVEMIADPEQYTPEPGDVFICAIGDPATKVQLSVCLREKGARFVTLIHPSAIVGPNCKIGEGCIICAHAILTADVVVGDFVTINVFTGVGHDAVIGDGCTLSAYVAISGGVLAGKGAFFGTHATVLPKMTVGDFAKVGAGSVAVRSVPDKAVVFGVPAKQIFIDNSNF